MKIQDFIPKAQLRLIRQLEKGEEGAFFTEKLAEIQNIIDNTPKTYAQDGLGDQAIVSLHYFGGAYDAWISEVDIDEDGEGQIQSFGLASFGGIEDAELGYISIKEIINTPGLELDLYFSPKTIKSLKGEV